LPAKRTLDLKNHASVYAVLMVPNILVVRAVQENNTR